MARIDESHGRDTHRLTSCGSNRMQLPPACVADLSLPMTSRSAGSTTCRRSGRQVQVIGEVDGFRSAEKEGSVSKDGSAKLCGSLDRRQAARPRWQRSGFLILISWLYFAMTVRSRTRLRYSSQKLATQGMEVCTTGAFPAVDNNVLGGCSASPRTRIIVVLPSSPDGPAGSDRCSGRVKLTDEDIMLPCSKRYRKPY
jgi:hypothetical protein